MRVMVLVKASEHFEGGELPTEEELAEMVHFNEELAEAGVLLDKEGLHPSARGKRVWCAGDERTVINGPFPGTRELVAGFWIWQVRSLEEAVEWLRRAPLDRTEVELRPLLEAEDLGAALTPELHAREEHLQTRMEWLRRGAPR